MNNPHEKYVDPELIEKARRMDLLTYLRLYEPDELIRISDGVYCTRNHDSLKISNGAWMWWSKGIGGYSALDYLIKVKDVPFQDAVRTICGQAQAAFHPCDPLPKRKEKAPGPLLLPQRAENNLTALSYLCSRGIDYRIAVECISKGLIYESMPYHNVIFIGVDKENIPRYAGYRSTDGSRILGDCTGSDKHYSFRMVGAESDEVHIFESSIDLLSFATLLKLGGVDHHRHNMISLSGIYAPSKKNGKGKIPAVLQDYLFEHPEVRKIIVHFDNDEKGRAAAQVIGNRLSDRYEVVDFPPPNGKDFNDFLLILRQQSKNRIRNTER